MCRPPSAPSSSFSPSPSTPGVGVRGVPIVEVGVVSGLSPGDQSSIGSSSSSTYFSGQSRFPLSSSLGVRLSWRVRPRPSPLACRTIACLASPPSVEARLPTGFEAACVAGDCRPDSPDGPAAPRRSFTNPPLVRLRGRLTSRIPSGPPASLLRFPAFIFPTSEASRRKRRTSTAYDASPMHRGSPSGDQSITRTRNGNVRPSPTRSDGSLGAPSSSPPQRATPTGDPNPPPSPLSLNPSRSSGDGSGNTTRTFHSGDVVLIRVAVLRVTPPYVSSQYGLLVRDSLFVAGSLCAPAASTTSAPPGPDAAAIDPSSDRRYAFSKS
mmetsp:Transcript_7572/g.31212  ORF Transcript_7572/g.31212 Transcript_7572/m.31212 type:complete len:324 (-) Transcript_7572:903-1874(-)